MDQHYTNDVLAFFVGVTSIIKISDFLEIGFLNGLYSRKITFSVVSGRATDIFYSKHAKVMFREHNALDQCWFNAGPASQTVAQQ